MVSLDLSRAMVRFIIPVIVMIVIAYVFRLFGFGWRIFKPASLRPGEVSSEDVFDKQLSLIREGDFSVYVESMRQDILRRAGEDPEFLRLRREYLQLVSQGSNRRDEKVSLEIDRLVVAMIDIYTRVTGKEGLSVASGRIR